jgi:hypothetical protein
MVGWKGMQQEEWRPFPQDSVSNLGVNAFDVVKSCGH